LKIHDHFEPKSRDEFNQINILFNLAPLRDNVTLLILPYLVVSEYQEALVE
jgi:hypothetical protein